MTNIIISKTYMKNCMNQFLKRNESIIYAKEITSLKTEDLDLYLFIIGMRILKHDVSENLFDKASIQKGDMKQHKLFFESVTRDGKKYILCDKEKMQEYVATMFFDCRERMLNFLVKNPKWFNAYQDYELFSRKFS